MLCDITLDWGLSPGDVAFARARLTGGSLKTDSLQGCPALAGRRGLVSILGSWSWTWGFTPSYHIAGFQPGGVGRRRSQTRRYSEEMCRMAEASCPGRCRLFMDNKILRFEVAPAAERAELIRLNPSKSEWLFFPELAGDRCSDGVGNAPDRRSAVRGWVADRQSRNCCEGREQSQGIHLPRASAFAEKATARQVGETG